MNSYSKTAHDCFKKSITISDRGGFITNLLNTSNNKIQIPKKANNFIPSLEGRFENEGINYYSGCHRD